jgi:hypothetical protein
MTASTHIPSHQLADPRAVSWKATAAAAGIGAAGGLVINTVIASMARSLFDVPTAFVHLTLPVYGTMTVAGALFGAVGWHLIAKRARHATRLLTWLVPAVFVLSVIPDLVLLITKAQPGTTTAGVIALMLMHVGVFAAAVPAYCRFIPRQS